jgi:hypothetical protein
MPLPLPLRLLPGFGHLRHHHRRLHHSSKHHWHWATLHPHTLFRCHSLIPAAVNPLLNSAVPQYALADLHAACEAFDKRERLIAGQLCGTNRAFSLHTQPGRQPLDGSSDGTCRLESLAIAHATDVLSCCSR